MARTVGDWITAALFALWPVNLGLLVGLDFGHPGGGALVGVVVAVPVTLWGLCVGWFGRNARSR